MTNGHNAAAAARAAGFTGSQVRGAGYRMLQHPAVQAILAGRARVVADLAGMTSAKWAEQLRSVTYSSVGDLFNDGGEPIAVTMLPPHVQAAISSIKVHRMSDGSERVEYKLWSKTAAMEIMARHLGLYEKDRGEQPRDIRVRVELVG
jgi:hypothetical protein